MMLLWKGLLLAAGSYLLGSVSASILISRTMLGSDVREMDDATLKTVTNPYLLRISQQDLRCRVRHFVYHIHFGIQFIFPGFPVHMHFDVFILCRQIIKIF